MLSFIRVAMVTLHSCRTLTKTHTHPKMHKMIVPWGLGDWKNG